MKEFDYKNVAKEIGWDFSKIKIKEEKKSNYNYYKQVLNNINSNTVMLDVGCGGAHKSILYYSFAKKIFMIDVEDEMLKKAKENLKKFCNKEKQKKFKILNCNGYKKLPFKDGTFNLVVSRHCGVNMEEVYRVLKKGGIFISEDIASNDCLELKQVFNRGQNYNEPEYEPTVVNKCLKKGFSTVNFEKFEFNEYYKNISDLEYLLARTPILNTYNSIEDKQTLLKYINNNTLKKGIKLKRRLWHLFLVK